MFSQKSSDSRRSGRAPRAAVLSVAAALTAPLAWAFGRIFEAPPRGRTMAASRRVIATVHGDVSTYEDGTGPGAPLLLARGAGTSSFAAEMQPLFEAFRGERPVIAADLLGHGWSIRAERRPTREEHVQAVETVLLDIATRYGGAVDVLACGVAAERCVEAARRNPSLVRSLTLVQATGLERGPARILRRIREGGVGRPLAERYDVVGVPTLFVHGSRALLQHGALRRLTCQSRTCSSALIEGAGIAPHVERTRDTAQVVRAFQRVVKARPRLRLIRGGRKDGASLASRRPSTSILRAARGGSD